MPTMTKDIRSETMAQNGLHGTSSPIAQPRPTLATTSGTATSGQDEFFTSSVAVQHKNGQRGQPNQSEIRRGSNESSSSMRSYHTATSTNTIQQQQQQHQQQHHHQNFEQTQSKDHAETGMFRAVPAQANPDVQEGNWENWREIAEQRRQEERQRAAQKAHQRKGTQMQEQQGSPATKNRQHQQTTSYDQYQSSSSQQMKQKHYFQEQQSMKERQIQAIYQQNQGQGPQQRIMEPQQQQQQTNVKMKVVSSNAGGNATYQDQRSLKEKKLALQQQRDHERQMMITERKRQEEHRFHEQRTQQQMEEVKLEEEQRIQQQKLLEERRFQEEQLIQKQKIQEQKRIQEEQRIQQQKIQEQKRIQEEQRIQQQKIQEQKRIQEEQRFHQQKVQEEKMIQQQIIENEKKIHEQRRIQEQAYFEEQQRLEETRFREQKKRFEEQMRMEEQRKQTEQDMVIRQQRERFEAERKKYEYSLANNHQFSRQEEKHLSKQFEQQSFQAAEPKTRRAPKVKLQKAQSFNQEDMESLKTDHFANIKTGQVNEKRHFWMRSSSNERLNEQRFQSPGPRRRWIGEKDWIRQQALKNLDNSSPQGSSFSHATDFGNVKHVAKDWTNIVKSKSSTAILQDNYESRSRPGSSLSKPVPSWLREDQASDSTLHLTRDIHTNQVKETVEAWPSKSRESSQQPHSGRSTPAPTRHIGESFADNRIAKDGKVELRYESAPTKASKVQPGNALEPSLKLVNVAVMRVKHEDQDKIKFSHTAQEQMKSFTSSETKATISNPSSNTFQEQKHSSDFTPLRKLGTKETIPEPIRHTQTIQEPNNKIQPVIPFGTTSSKSTQNYNSQEHFQHMTAKQHTAKAEKFSLNTPDFVHKEQIDGTKSGGYRFEAPRSSNIPTSNSQENNEQRQLPTRPNEEQRDEHILANSFKSSVSKSSKTDAQQTATQNQWTTKTSVSKPQEPRESFFEPSGPTQPMQKPLRQSLEPTPTMNKTTSNFSTASFMQKNNQMKKQPMQDSKVHSDGQMFAKPEVRPQETAHSMTIIEDKMQAADNSSSHSYDKSVVNMNAAKPTFGRTPPKIPFSKGRAGEDGTQGKPPVPSPRIPSPDKRPPPTMPKPKMQPVVPLNVANKNLEPQNGLPMPVSQSWFDASAEASEVSSTSSFGHFEQIAPPQGTNKTPIPVLAGWFDEEQRKGKPQSNESLKHKPQTQRGAQAPIPPPPPPPQMNKKEKRVDFVEPPPFSPPPESDISSLNIEEMSEGGTDIEEIPIRGNVKGNIALFQEGSTGNRPKQGGHEDWKDSMKGCVSQSRQAYVQQTSNLDKDDSERLERQKELEEISKARAQTNWDNTSPHEGSESLKDSRTRELQAIAELRSKRAADAWEAERSSEKVLEATRDQRAKELQEIASMRSQNNWDEVNAEVRAKADRSQVIQEQRQIDHGPTEPSPQPLPKNPNDLDIDEMISSFQDVAASWQQRESEPQAPANQTQRAEVPSRRIGNLFKRPPAQTGESPNIPSPPPRESSKDYMMDVHQQNKQI
ncbi:uncharacterized protein LOC131887871 isoform X2 [Tigriopus californicus]|uniref:uncharacterized protein LOC131887871 isoform X2 n=1 Tax=Tigriopus californicus TaxID=6832 RepID=UPI0027DA29DD|nr:uncharacterized protein LOC131887871 isoform X2 [Tigriopus californicus]